MAGREASLRYGILTGDRSVTGYAVLPWQGGLANPGLFTQPQLLGNLVEKIVRPPGAQTILFSLAKLVGLDGQWNSVGLSPTYRHVCLHAPAIQPKVN